MLWVAEQQTSDLERSPSRYRCMTPGVLSSNSTPGRRLPPDRQACLPWCVFWVCVLEVGCVFRLFTPCRGQNTRTHTHTYPCSAASVVVAAFFCRPVIRCKASNSSNA